MFSLGNHEPYGNCEDSRDENPAPTRSKSRFASDVEGSINRDMLAFRFTIVVGFRMPVQSNAPVQLARRSGSWPSAPGLSKIPLLVRSSLRSLLPKRKKI